MLGSLTYLLCAVPAFADLEAEKTPLFDNYTKAHRVARRVERPMLVILNPARDSETKPISLSQIRRTKKRRSLLKNYVLVVIDTSTKHGQVMNRAFGNQTLPRVVVIDKRQNFQIFKTSEALYGQLWTDILQTYQAGEAVLDFKLGDAFCST